MSAGTVVRRIVVDDSDPTIQFGPNGWYVADISKLNVGNYGPVYNKTSHATSTSGSTLSFPFNGTSISVLGTIAITTDANNVTDPTWECSVDGVKIGNPQPTFPFAENNWLLCDQSQLASGSHTLTMSVQSKGQPFYFDSIIYTPLPSISYETAVLEYTNRDPSVSFGSGWQQWGAQNVTQTAGAQVALNFHGTSVSLFGYVPTELPHTASSASYTIDGGPPVPFVLNGLAAQSPTIYNTLFFTTNTLTPATHNLVVTYAGDSSKTPLVVSTFYVTNITTLSTSNPPSPSSSSDPSTTAVTHTKSTPTGAIAGGIVSVLVVLAVIVGLIFLCRRRRRRAEEQMRHTSANPFPTSAGGHAVSASLSGTSYPYSVVPGRPSTTMQPFPTGPTYPYATSRPQHDMPTQPYSDGSSLVTYPSIAPRTVTDATSSTGLGEAAPVPYPTPVSSDGSVRPQKYERELLAAQAMTPPAPLVPLRANRQRPVVMHHHQDSGVRLNSAAALPPPEPEIVELPPDYSRD